MDRAPLVTRGPGPTQPTGNRCDLKLLLAEAPPERIPLSIVDGPKIKLKHFDLIETAVIETPVGALNTVHYRLIHEEPDERSSDTWLAVDHDFLMVRTETCRKKAQRR